MNTRKPDRESVYAAAEAWVERALRSDDSLFTPGRPIWTTEWLEELHHRFLDSPDVSDMTFLDKLERQLAGSPPEACQLMAEVLYVHFIVVSRKNSTGVQTQLQQVLNWSPQPVAIPSELVAGLTPGIANPGQGFHRYKPHQIGLIIEFASQWKRLEPDQRQRLLLDPWSFKDYVMHLDLHSALFRDEYVSPRIQQHALLHLVHPDTFEPIVSVNHKEMIATHYEGLVEDPEQDLDHRLQQIRAALEEDLGEDFTFYDPSIRSQWDTSRTPDGWDELVDSARKDQKHGTLKELRKSKAAVADQLSEARTTLFEPPRVLRRLWCAQGEADTWPYRVKHASKRLEVMALDLSGTLAEVLERVQSVAASVQRMREEASQVRAAA